MDMPLPAAEHQSITFPEPFALESGAVLPGITVAYQSYGTLNAARTNAILVCHALTGDQYVAGAHPLTGKPGWWTAVVGAGLPIDTDRYFVVCANVLGGCMGSTGPRSERPGHDGEGGGEGGCEGGGGGEVWGTDFPTVTIADMVRAQKRLVDHLGITRLFAAVGGSMGGMQVLQWAALFPEAVFAAVPVATAAFHSAQNIAFHEVGRQAIFADPDWQGGFYWREGRIPARGLAVARMAAHITYLSEQALTRKFGRRVRQTEGTPAPQDVTLFADMFEVESYLRHQGSTFVTRFDANSYLTITRAMDLFDLAADHGNDLAAAFRGSPTRFCMISFTSDWLFPTAQSRAIARALNGAGANASFVEIASDKGHDAFLLDEPDMHRTLRGFLAGCAEHAGLAERARDATPATGAIRPELQLISRMVAPRTRVLDIGSGDGTLIEHLFRTQGCDARGIEIDMAAVTHAVAHGLPVMHGDADTDLAHYPDGVFDYVVLSRTLQAVERPREVLRQMLRIGTRALVSFPNFGHWRVRWQLLHTGRMPMTSTWDRPWHETPNIHPCTIEDFFDLCRQEGYAVEEWLAVDDAGHRTPWRRYPVLANVFGEQALFLLRRA